MSGTLLLVATGAGAIGCAVLGGVFFAFSGFIMPALRRLPPAEGAAAMQSMNITAVMPPLMIALFGTALVCLALIIGTLLGRGPGAMWRIAGSLIYLIGVVGVTMAGNVPLNNALAAADPASEAGAATWARFVPGWTAWNHVRTIAGIAAASALVYAITEQLRDR